MIEGGGELTWLRGIRILPSSSLHKTEFFFLSILQRTTTPGFLVNTFISGEHHAFGEFSCSPSIFYDDKTSQTCSDSVLWDSMRTSLFIAYFLKHLCLVVFFGHDTDVHCVPGQISSAPTLSWIVLEVSIYVHDNSLRIFLLWWSNISDLFQESPQGDNCGQFMFYCLSWFIFSCYPHYFFMELWLTTCFARTTLLDD